MNIRLDQLKKLESSSFAAPAQRDENDRVEAVVKTRTPDYVPADVQVRAKIDPHLFTCVIPVRSLLDLETDPEVVSVAVSKKLHVG